MKNLNRLAKEIHKANHHWWHDSNGKRLDRNKGELLMLVITELAEAVEGIRKNLMDDKLPHRKMEEVEMADALIRILDFAGGFEVHLERMAPTFFQSQNKAEQILLICSPLIAARSKTDPGSSLALAICGIELYCITHRLDLWGAVKEKRAFNKTRADHKPENRKKKNGKRF